MFNIQAMYRSILAFLLVVLPFTVCAQEVGKIRYTRGAVTLQKADGSDARLAGKDDLILQGEVITGAVEDNSFSFQIADLMANDTDGSSPAGYHAS